MGVKTINVKKKPDIYVIITGDELITKIIQRALFNLLMKSL